MLGALLNIGRSKVSVKQRSRFGTSCGPYWDPGECAVQRLKACHKRALSDTETIMGHESSILDGKS